MGGKAFGGMSGDAWRRVRVRGWTEHSDHTEKCRRRLKDRIRAMAHAKPRRREGWRVTGLGRWWRRFGWWNGLGGFGVAAFQNFAA